jgi:hypothetical protein
MVEDAFQIVQDGTRWAQDTLKTARAGPKMAQRRTKTVLDGPSIMAQDGAKMLMGSQGNLGLASRSSAMVQF